MSRVLAKISDVLRLQPHDIAPTVTIFPTTDERSLATRLDIDRRGRADGAQELPPAGATDLGATEQEIVSALSSIRSQGLSDYAQELKTYEERGELGDDVYVRRKFCPNCGSPIVSELAKTAGVLAVKAGSLDDRSDVSPNVEVWCVDRQPWVSLPGMAVSLDRE